MSWYKTTSDLGTTQSTGTILCTTSWKHYHPIHVPHCWHHHHHHHHHCLQHCYQYFLHYQSSRCQIHRMAEKTINWLICNFVITLANGRFFNLPVIAENSDAQMASLHLMSGSQALIKSLLFHTHLKYSDCFNLVLSVHVY